MPGSKRKALPLLASALLGIASAAPAARAAQSPLATGLLRAVNEARRTHGLGPLRLDPRLEQAARRHSTEMLRRDRFGHGAFARRMAAFRAPGVVQAEVIAWGTGPLGTPEAIVQAWLGSPPHRRDLLRPGFVRIGIGAFRGSFRGRSDATVVTADLAGS